MIAKLWDKIKAYQYQAFLSVCILLISFISFNMGKISSGEKGELKITQNANIYKAVQGGEEGIGGISSTPKFTPKPLDMRVVASKASDSKRYHYSWCKTWKRIKDENQLWFNTEQEAIAAGYTLAGNCTR